MTTLTAADYADTGQWRLIVNIFTTGISAYLENTIHKDVEPQELFSTFWDSPSGDLLKHIENAVYDHPRVLDDFSARIVVYDRKTLFMPTELLTETEGSEEAYYTSVYPGEEADVMCDTDKDVTAAFMLAPGLRGFLGRTFPGARISSHLMDIVSANRRTGEGLRLVVRVRKGEADYVLFTDDALLSASTHSWSRGEDICYTAFNLLDVYGANPAETEIITDGTPLPEEASQFFARFAGKVTAKL